MTVDRPPADPEALEREVIARLYEVAIDPTRYEGLLDRWEALMAPHRGPDSPESGPANLGEVERHVLRAHAVLDKVLAASSASDADDDSAADRRLVEKVDMSVALSIDRGLTVRHANAAARRTLQTAPGRPLAEVALGPGEAAILGHAVARLFSGNTEPSCLIRLHKAGSGRLVVMRLRLIRPDSAPPFVLAVASELAWPAGFNQVLRDAFELTPAETEVIRALAEGQAISDIAAARNRSVATVRAQLKALMQKTETRSQSELVRLTLATMEMARHSDEASEGVLPMSGGDGLLEPRPFRTLVLKDGRRFDYLILGDPNGRAALFLPLDYGLIRWPARAEAAASDAGLKIIVPIRPGYGASTPLPRHAPYVAQLVEDHAALLDHLKVGAVPIVSLGGDSYLAIAFHAAHPDRVTRLICCAGVLPMTRRAQYDRMDKWHRFVLTGARYTPHMLPFMVKAGFALARRLGKRQFIHAVYGNSAADIATIEDPEVLEAILTGTEVALSDTHMAHDAFSREVIAHETTDWHDEVAALRGGPPVTFLNGLQDPQTRPETLAEFEQDHPWIEFRRYPDAGQLLFFSKWPDVLDLLTRAYGPNAVAGEPGKKAGSTANGV